MGKQQLPKPWIETPLIESNALSRAAECRVFLKLENLQPGSSFKSRGIGNVILQSVAHHNVSGNTQPLHFYCSSGGNAGLACVTAARSLGYPATIVVPMTTDAMMIARIRAAGASEVIRHGQSWMYADAHLRDDIMAPRMAGGKEESVYVPPFDHHLVWEGASTIVEELQYQLPQDERPDAIICSVGGGGLLSGINLGLEKAGWVDVKVIATETKGADSLNAAVKAGELVTLPGITSLAKCLGAVRVCQQALVAAQKPNVTSVVLSDAQACMGCWRFADDHRILVEAACGVSIAPCYNGMLKRLVPDLRPESKVVVVVCGGSDITIERLAEYRERFGKEADAESTVNVEVPSSHSAPAGGGITT